MFWYEDEVKRLELTARQMANKSETIFYGSSTVRMWDTLATDLSNLKPVNLGFGGSTLAACVWFFTRVMQGYQPKRMVVYAGDNDLGDGRHPEEIFIFFKQLAASANQRFGNIPCYFISLKPSPSRWYMADQFKFTNKIIAEEIKSNHANWQYIDVFSAMLNADGKPNGALFLDDGLHLSKQGYQVWKNVIAASIGVDS